MCFVVLIWAFDDVMAFEYLKGVNLIISRTKRAFQVKKTTFFLVSRFLSFRITKQTSKNVAETNFVSYEENITDLDFTLQCVTIFIVFDFLNLMGKLAV